MKKILLILLVLFFSINNNVLASYWIIYKDNILNGTNFNWKQLDENFVKILVNEKWKILHTITKKKNDDKVNGFNFYLNGKILDIESANRVFFLENGSVLITEFAPLEWKKNYMSLDWQIIFEWNNDEYNSYEYTKILKTEIKDVYDEEFTLRTDRYFKNELWDLLKIVKWRKGLYIINKDKDFLMYDVICRDNKIVLYYEWKDMTDVIKSSMLYFPEERNWIATYLNINWKSHLLKNGNVLPLNECVFYSNNEKININNSNIVKLNNTNNPIWRKEYIGINQISEITNNWNHKIIIEQWFKKYIINYDNKKYEIFYSRKMQIFISENLDIIFAYENEDKSMVININWEDIYKWKKEDAKSFIKQEGENIYFIIDGKEIKIEFYRGYKYKSELFKVRQIELYSYKNFIKLWQEKVSNLKQDNKKTIQIKSNNIYSKLDLKLEILYGKLSKKDLKYQINTYKKLKSIIKKLQKKYTSWVKKELIDYLYEKINFKYKKVFKEYIIKK